MSWLGAAILGVSLVISALIIASVLTDTRPGKGFPQ